MRWPVTAANAARAKRAHAPPKSLPIETLGSEKAQRQTLYPQAKACVDGGKPQRAVALITQVIKSDPTDAVAYLNRGSAQAAQERSPSRSATSASPSASSQIWSRPGKPRHDLHPYASVRKGIADFTEAIRLNLDFALAYCNRGLANVQLGRYDEALADIRSPSARIPTSPTATSIAAACT